LTLFSLEEKTGSWPFVIQQSKNDTNIVFPPEHAEDENSAAHWLEKRASSKPVSRDL
jgi:hypothetical protein